MQKMENDDWISHLRWFLVDFTPKWKTAHISCFLHVSEGIREAEILPAEAATSPDQSDAKGAAN